MALNQSQGLYQRQSTSLAMTPQMQQLISMLQLTSLEMNQEINRQVEENPLLEIEDDVVQENVSETGEKNGDETAGDRNGGEAGSGTDADADADAVLSDGAETVQPGTETDVVTAMETDSLPKDDDSPLDDTWDKNWEEGVTAVHKSSIADSDDSFDYQGSTRETLKDHLLWQLNLSPFSKTDNAIARAVIDAVNDAGYLTESVEDLIDAAQNILLEDRIEDEGLDFSEINIEKELAEQEEILPEEVISVIHRVQLFDPVGVAAMDMKESMLVQLRHLHSDSPYYEKARELLTDHIRFLESKDFRSIRRRMSVKEDELKSIMLLIRSLDPQPGAGFIHDDSVYFKPDVLVRRENGDWHVVLNPDCYPRVRINQSYASLAESKSEIDSKDDRQYLKKHLSEARSFLDNFNRRNDTLLRVARCIVNYQKDFFDYGPEKMKPLILSTIAEECGVHESTVSRITNQKYMCTPRGSFELKYFFSSSLRSDVGDDCSSTAVQAKIRKLIDGENKRKPLSDSAISAILSEDGINVARRTVAKYRETMKIPPTSQRKQL